MRKVTDTEVKRVASFLNLDLRKLSLKTLKKGIKVELEHGYKGSRTNVSCDDLVITAKIALAHIIEFPDYYERLEKLEKEAKKYWGNYKFNPYKN